MEDRTDTAGLFYVSSASLAILFPISDISCPRKAKPVLRTDD